MKSLLQTKVGGLLKYLNWKGGTLNGDGGNKTKLDDTVMDNCV